jgi:REP element-mobilizing transposase RayT
MAFDYKIIENNGVYCVWEIPTEQTIKTFMDRKEAKKFLRHLNLGGGFSGWTPTFFMKEVDVKTSTT